MDWIPKWGEDRIHGMLEARPDWCLSRQRTWGVPIAVVYCQKCGHPVVSEERMNRVAEVFEKEGGNFHLVFSDVVLPDRSGIKLVDELLSRRPGLPILLSSGYTDQKSQWPVIQEKGFRFLQKPYSLVNLLGTVDELL